MDYSLVVAVDENYGISKEGRIPWKLPREMARFTYLTRDMKNTIDYNNMNVVIMGRYTWETIPEKYRPLPQRINIIISSSLTDINDENCHILDSLPSALEWCLNNDVASVFVIGGSRLYNEALEDPKCKTAYVSYINYDYNCDNFINKELLLSQFERGDSNVYSETGICVEFLTYCRKENYEEQQYLNLLKTILEENGTRETRNAPTYSIFAPRLEFDLSNGFPVLTTKRMFWRGIVKELLFFLKGQTDSRILSDDGIRIWDDNTSREFLDSRNLDYEEGDMGPMYGWNWRHFGAEYIGKDHDYTGQGFDQLRDCIDKIINDPTSRRIMMTAFDPSKVEQSVLAPCHSLVVQFYIKDGVISEHMYQRSADAFLGVPFNITSSALLLCLIAKATGLEPGKLIMSFGDMHIYEEHLEQVNKQLQREPYIFPGLDVNKYVYAPTVDNVLEFLETVTYEDIELLDYKHYKGIKANMIA